MQMYLTFDPSTGVHIIVQEGVPELHIQKHHIMVTSAFVPLTVLLSWSLPPLLSKPSLCSIHIRFPGHKPLVGGKHSVTSDLYTTTYQFQETPKHLANIPHIIVKPYCGRRHELQTCYGNIPNDLMLTFISWQQ